MYFIILPIYSCKVRDFSRHVIQSEAKNLDYTHFMLPKSFVAMLLWMTQQTTIDKTYRPINAICWSETHFSLPLHQRKTKEDNNH